jgi:uncharacterized damage-inducible protein DinB
VSVTELYADWAGYNRRITDAIRPMSAEDLALTVPDTSHWPIWAVVGHMAGVRPYWLCAIAGEPGQESTPFTDPSGLGWEDDLDHPRSAQELVAALDSTWAIVAATLERWTPAMLGEPIIREGQSGRQSHTRQSILLRCITHDAYHAGEISLALSTNGREPIDLWPSEDWLVQPQGE